MMSTFKLNDAKNNPFEKNQLHLMMSTLKLVGGLVFLSFDTAYLQYDRNG